MNTIKVIFGFILCVLLFCQVSSCKKTDVTAESVIQETKAEKSQITAKDIDQIEYIEYALSDLAEDATKDWLKFQELLNHIEILKKGDLSFVTDDKTILIGFITDLKNEIPENVNATSIVVRMTVLETTLFKLEGVSAFYSTKKEEMLSALKDVLLAHNNLIFQINKKFEKESQKIEKPN